MTAFNWAEGDVEMPTIDGQRVVDDRFAFKIGAGKKMRLGRNRREFVALDRKAEECDARRGSVGHFEMLPVLRDRDPRLVFR